MRSSLFVAALAAVTAGVEAIAISSNTTSDLLSPTTRRRGCGRGPSSGASSPVSVDVSSTTSAATFPPFTPTDTTIAPQTTSETAVLTSIGEIDSTISPTEPSIETSETVSTTISGTESSTEAPILASSTLSPTDSSAIEATGIIPPTLITTEPTSETSTTTVPTTTFTGSTTEAATSDTSNVSVTELSTGIPTEIASSMTETSSTGVSESSTSDSASLATTATSTTTAPTCTPTNTVNGDFEAGPSDWKFTGNGEILQNGDDIFDTPYGNYYAKLTGFVDTTSVISQAVANVASSATLSVNYRLADSWDATASCTLTATYADIILGFMTLNINSEAAMGWQTTSWSAVGMPASGTLAISWGQCSSMNSNVALDNVFLISDCPGDSPVASV